VQSLRDIAPYLALGASVLSLVLLALVVRLLVGQRRLRRAQLAVLGTHGERDLVAHAQDLEEQVRNLRDAVQGLDDLLATYKTQLDKSFTRRAVVRYDAFRDIGGEQSASIALLDNTASGLVISMIHSRDYARIYVKQLRQSVPDRALSPEEVDVVEAALNGPAAAAGLGASASAAPRPTPAPGSGMPTPANAPAPAPRPATAPSSAAPGSATAPARPPGGAGDSQPPLEQRPREPRSWDSQ
jgi:Protein of unknown function (DUF4446)